MTWRATSAGPSPEERRRLRELFDALHGDGGGTLELAEFRDAFRMMLGGGRAWQIWPATSSTHIRTLVS